MKKPIDPEEHISALILEYFDLFDELSKCKTAQPDNIISVLQRQITLSKRIIDSLMKDRVIN